MHTRFLLLVAVFGSSAACASHRAVRTVDSAVSISDRDRVFVDVAFYRLTPEATARLVGSDVGAEGRTVVFDAARSQAFYRDVKSPSEGVNLVDSTIFLAVDGMSETSDTVGVYHWDENRLLETDPASAIRVVSTQAFGVAVLPNVVGDRLTLDVKSVWSDVAWVGKSPRPDFLDLSATSSLPTSGSSVLLISRELEIGAGHRERYILAVSPTVLGASQASTRP